MFLARGRLGQIGQDKELSAPVAPARRLGDRPRTSLGVVKPIEPAISVSLENPGIVGQMALRVLAVAVAGIEEQGSGRGRSGKRPIIADVCPNSAGHRLALGQHRHRGVVRVKSGSAQHMEPDQLDQRGQVR